MLAALVVCVGLVAAGAGFSAGYFAALPPTSPQTAPEESSGPPAEEAPTLGGPYDGPLDASAVLAACPGDVANAKPCYTETLKKLLAAKGSEHAFDVLDDMSKREVDILHAAHPISHEMGAHALRVYGGIAPTLAACSYKVFQGCIHGALQAHFRALPALNASSVQGLCPSGEGFHAYVCLHGVGHGLVLAHNYAIHESLRLCDAIDGSWGQSSCYGGVFMENFGGWRATQDAIAEFGHDHGNMHGPAPRYWVDPQDLDHPCDVVGDRYEWSCWFFQTSLILYHNGGNFTDASARCAALGEPLLLACFGSLGRDVSVYKNYEVAPAADVCAQAPPAGQAPCIRGVVANSVLFFAAPDAGLPICRAVPEDLKLACYQEVAFQGRSMVPDRMADVCAQVEPAYVEACRQAAGLPVA